MLMRNLLNFSKDNPPRFPMKAGRKSLPQAKERKAKVLIETTERQRNKISRKLQKISIKNRKASINNWKKKSLAILFWKNIFQMIHTNLQPSKKKIFEAVTLLILHSKSLQRFWNNNSIKLNPGNMTKKILTKRALRNFLLISLISQRTKTMLLQKFLTSWKQIINYWANMNSLLPRARFLPFERVSLLNLIGPSKVEIISPAMIFLLSKKDSMSPVFKQCGAKNSQWGCKERTIWIF